MAASPGAPKSSRHVALWPASDLVPVYDRSCLARGQVLAGPAIVEERETTIVLPLGWEAVVDDLGCIVAMLSA